MNNVFVLYSLAVVTFMFSIGCKDSGVHVKNVEFLNTTWKLESFETVGVGATRIQDGRVYSITFLPDTIARVRADCNDCMTNYQTLGSGTDPQIAVKILYCTEVYCGSESLDWRFLNGLRDATNYRIQGDLLHIYYNQKIEVLNFRAQQ